MLFVDRLFFQGQLQMSGRYGRILCCAGVAVTMVMMTSCTSQPRQVLQGDEGFREGQALIAQGRVEDGLMRMTEIQAQYPDNLEYRNHLSRQRDLHLAKLLRDADALRQQQQWDAAESQYRRVLDMDMQNQRAKDGLKLAATGLRHQKLIEQAEQMYLGDDTDGALTMVRSVLAENAADGKARALYERIERKKLEKVMAPARLRAEFRKPITLEFKDTSLKALFEFISKAANINFTFDRELRQEQKTSIFVRDTSIDEALRIILMTNQLEKKVLNDNTLLIYPVSRRQEYQELFVRSFYLSNTDAKRALALVKTVLKTQDVYIDEQLNTLVMRDTPEAILMAEKLIASQDLAEPEVMLEVEVMEVSRKSLESIGIQYPTRVGVGVHGASDISKSPGKLTLSELKHFDSDMGVFTITDPVLALNLLGQDTDTNLLANPHIRVKNREKARIHIGDKIPVITSTANSTGFVSESVTYLDVGVKLDVEPTILLQDEVSIRVALEVSNQTDQVKTSSGTLTYSLGTRNASTVLRLKDGETQVLAGLFRDDTQDTINKVPGLSSLPLLGKLFTDRSSDKRKKEIVLLITPRILSNISPQDAAYTVFPAGTDSTQGKAARSGRQSGYSQPQARQEPVVQTPEETQTARARSDRSFADMVIESQP
jgi:general secretion pathway protein D